MTIRGACTERRIEWEVIDIIQYRSVLFFYVCCGYFIS